MVKSLNENPEEVKSTTWIDLDNKMSEELEALDLVKNPLKVGPYEYYPIGQSTVNQLKSAGIIPKKKYSGYESQKPDGLLVDRRNKNDIQVLCVVERKLNSEFNTEEKRKKAVEQCNNLSQELEASIGIATDGSSFIWFNPNHPNLKKEYIEQKKSNPKKRSYSLIKDEKGSEFIDEFIIDQKQAEEDLDKLTLNTKQSIESFEKVKNNISYTNSQLSIPLTKDPTDFAKQIWQILWIASGERPDKCLLTFVEFFVFKYLSDLNILTKDKKGNKINFEYIYALEKEEAFANYSDNVRKYLKKELFPSYGDTTIMNRGVLDPKVPEHSDIFYSILKKFDEYGKLKNIDPKFKSKVFENFMKGKTEGIKNLGRFFTPRTVIDAMVEISDIEKLPENSEICDPACGVGGFILESLKVKNDGLNFYYKVVGDKIIPRHKFKGYDIGTSEEGRLTTILAKANMLIFISDLLKNHRALAPKFSELFGNTFESLGEMLGTLRKINQKEKYDLILTNPPYTTRGITAWKKVIKDKESLRNFYTINGGGKEGLFLEWIIRSLKCGGKAFVILPDGIFSRGYDYKIRQFLKDECIIDGIISLPQKTFYTTPKKNIHFSNN